MSPRIWRHIIGEGAFCDDELTLSYFGGVLASSRNDNSIDDRGLTFVSLLESMSSYQIRTHYIFYTILRNNCAGSEIKIENKWNQKLQVFIPYDEYLSSMNMTHNDQSVFLPHIFEGLVRLGLISNYCHGKTDILRTCYSKANGPGFTILPNIFGIELYLWANGHSDIPATRFLDKDIQFVNGKLLDMPSGAEIFGC